MGGGGGSPAASGSGSSSEDDGDAAWKAAIESVAAVGFGVPSSNGVAKAASGGSGEVNNGEEPEQPHQGKTQAPGLKLYQIKARNMLDDMLEKNLEIVKAPCLNLTEPTETEGGIKLFKKAPPGIKMDSMDKLHVQLKRPKIVPGEEFKHMLRSVVVDGNDVIISAKKASQRSLARLEARAAAAKAKAKEDEERVQQLKKVRGEKWLPSVARQMKEEKAWEQRRQ
ncbi:hypothetical protein U9M48_006479 [Paspalum notatum var. saurae]|uniref:Uncharacterized protein n=1 Tax=Paspalum notatum var. saurae TaxID=547442 RepID=A0AAQ3PP54_PASNO